jgi:adenine/guanine/hypoxanthine permease
MKNWLEGHFKIAESNSNLKTEVLAGSTTFLTMAYIIVLQPLVLSGNMFGFSTGMDYGSVMLATCLSAALATMIMAFWARLPVAQAPGMGENFFFVFSVIPAAAAAGFAEPWRVGLGVVFISGILFLLATILGLRAKLLNAVSQPLKLAMGGGIGLFIAFIGLQNAGLIESAASIVSTADGPILSPGTLVRLGQNILSIDFVIFAIGIMLTAVGYSRKWRAPILLGIIGSTLLAFVLQFILGFFPDAITNIEFLSASKLFSTFQPAETVLSMPPAIAPTFFKMDLASALQLSMLPYILIFLFMDVFDTMGTLVAVSWRANFSAKSNEPKIRRAMFADAAGTISGACLGTSTVTSFIESAAGIEEGGRTGMTALTVALLFLVAPFFSPIIMMVGSYPILTAPALIFVGMLMMRSITEIPWTDASEALPAFLIIIGIPLSYSISDGLALGLIAYPLVKLFSGKASDTNFMSWLTAIMLLFYLLILRS